MTEHEARYASNGEDFQNNGHDGSSPPPRDAGHGDYRSTRGTSEHEGGSSRSRDKERDYDRELDGDEETDRKTEKSKDRDRVRDKDRHHRERHRDRSRERRRHRSRERSERRDRGYVNMSISKSVFGIITQPSQAYLNMSSSMKLKDIAPAATNNIDLTLIIVDKGSPVIEGRTKTCLALAADETAAVHLQLWGDECDAFKPADIIRLEKAIFSFDRRKNLVLRSGWRGKIVKLGEFTMMFVETPNMSEIRWICDSCNKFIQHSVVSTHSRIFPALLCIESYPFM